jgi:hypothetical protein
LTQQGIYTLGNSPSLSLPSTQNSSGITVENDHSVTVAQIFNLSGTGGTLTGTLQLSNNVSFQVSINMPGLNISSPSSQYPEPSNWNTASVSAIIDIW